MRPREVRRAAALLGRRGGKKRSEQKSIASRTTGRTVGGRKAVQSFGPERDGVADGTIVLLGFRSTGERELRRKGRWYRSRSGRPMLVREDSAALSSGEGAPSIDFFERIEPSHDTASGRVIKMTCGKCNKVQFFLFTTLTPGYMEQESDCRACI